MLAINEFRYFRPEEVDVGRCPLFNPSTRDTECYAEPRLGCWPSQLKNMDVPKEPARYQNCPVYAQTTRGHDFVLGEHTATRLDLLDDTIRKYNLKKWGIDPVGYMRLADMTLGIQGTHTLYNRDREFTVIIRGVGKVNGNNFGVVRVIRRGKQSRNTPPLEIEPAYPYGNDDV